MSRRLHRLLLLTSIVLIALLSGWAGYRWGACGPGDARQALQPPTPGTAAEANRTAPDPAPEPARTAADDAAATVAAKVSQRHSQQRLLELDTELAKLRLRQAALEQELALAKVESANARREAGEARQVLEDKRAEVVRLRREIFTLMTGRPPLSSDLAAEAKPADDSLTLPPTRPAETPSAAAADTPWTVCNIDWPLRRLELSHPSAAPPAIGARHRLLLSGSLVGTGRTVSHGAQSIVLEMESDPGAREYLQPGLEIVLSPLP